MGCKKKNESVSEDLRKQQIEFRSQKKQLVDCRLQLVHCQQNLKRSNEKQKTCKKKVGAIKNEITKIVGEAAEKNPDKEEINSSVRTIARCFRYIGLQKTNVEDWQKKMLALSFVAKNP